MDELAFRSATELTAALTAREVSSRELLDCYLDRIDRLDPALGALVTLDADGARRAASAADQARLTTGGPPPGPLAGLPMTVKDSIETAGLRTTSGAPFLAGYVPERDADAVARLRAAGAVVFGKTNLPMFAADVQTTNELFGTTVNPWDAERTPGGSSGGSAAAVAAGLTGLELGSDLGGSLRMPAHFCGVYTVKPSYGLVPQRGHIPPEPGVLVDLDIATLGPLARAADDLDLALAVLAGPDPARARAWQVALPAPRRASLRDYRLAAWLDDPYCAVDGGVLAPLQAAVDALRSEGVSVLDVAPGAVDAPPMTLREGHDLAQRLTQGAVGPFLPPDDYAALASRAAAADPSDDSPPVRFARNVTQSARSLGQAAERRMQLRAGWAAFFERFDVLLCPVTPTTAFPHDHDPDVDARTLVINGVRRPYGDQFAWVQSFGALHLPAVVAPVGSAPDGLPVGMQLVAPYLEDRSAIDLARRLADVVGGYRRPPGW